MKFLNKLYVKAIFSEDSTLNVIASDMGEEQITISLTEDIVKRLPTATGTVGSLAIFVPAEVTISLLKTSPVCALFLTRVQKNGYIGGTLTVYDDVNFPLTVQDVSIKTAEFDPANGDSPQVKVVIAGNCAVNSQALTGI